VTGALDKLEFAMKTTPMKHLVKSVFLGQSTSIMVCKNCNNINQNHEDFSTLDFQVKNQKDIYDSLKNMVAGEIIQDYLCSKCN
jgi:ubiquitin C-terminal hydrolase